MLNLAEQLLGSGTELSSGAVKGAGKDAFLIEDENGDIITARKAASCLVEPRKGDTVLHARTGAGKMFIVAVLERPGGAATSIEFDGDVEIAAPRGKLEITARDGVTLGTPGELLLIAEKMGLSAQTCEAVFEQLELFGSGLRTGWETVKFHAHSAQTVVDSVLQKLGSRHTQVRGLDSLSAGSVKQAARDIFSLRSKFAFMKADKNVKIDGKQIFMG